MYMLTFWIMLCNSRYYVTAHTTDNEDAQFSYNTSVTYMCIKGYNLTSDTNVLTCLSIGNWSRDIDFISIHILWLADYYISSNDITCSD